MWIIALETCAITGDMRDHDILEGRSSAWAVVRPEMQAAVALTIKTYRSVSRADPCRGQCGVRDHCA
jgi:hypothetical protein